MWVGILPPNPYLPIPWFWAAISMGRCQVWDPHVLPLPLKLGRIRASYPDVRPISLSRKSEGDMGWDDLREAAFISSRPETSLWGRGARLVACWHQGSAGTFRHPARIASCRGSGCARAASAPVPSQRTDPGTPSSCRCDPSGFPLACHSQSATCPPSACPPASRVPWHGVQHWVPPGSRAAAGTERSGNGLLHGSRAR